eukprot:125132_1
MIRTMSTRKRKRSKTVIDIQQSNQEHPNKKRRINDTVIINTIKTKINQSKIGFTDRCDIETSLKIPLNKDKQLFIKKHFNILPINNKSFLIYDKHNVNLMATIYYMFVEKYSSNHKKSKSPNKIEEIRISFETSLSELESQILLRESIDPTMDTFTIEYASKSNERRFMGQCQPTIGDKTQTIITFFGKKIVSKVDILVKIINLKRKNNNNLNIKSKQSSVSRVSHSEIQN